MKPLLVGEANPYQTDPRLAQHFALYPDPPGCAGWRLCKLVMGLEPDDYLARFDRANLCDGKWSMKEARPRVDELIAGRLVVVLFGAKVAEAARLRFAPFTTATQKFSGIHQPATLVILPHPSGLSRAWNEPGAYERARAVLREAGVL